MKKQKEQLTVTEIFLDAWNDFNEAAFEKRIERKQKAATKRESREKNTIRNTYVAPRVSIS